MGSSPDQYTCDCTGTGYQGANCTEGKCYLELTVFHFLQI